MAMQSPGSFIGRLFSRPGLGPTLVLLLVVLIAGAVGSVGYLSFRNGQDGVNDLAAQLQDSLQARIKQNLDEFLSKPHSLNRINAEALWSGLVNPRDLPGQRSRFLHQVQAFDSVVTCAFGSEGGDFIGAGWRSEGVLDTALADKSMDNDYRVFILDERGQPAELASIVQDYDPRSRSWYQAALEAGQPAWSPIYVWASRNNIGISAAPPVHDGAGALMGVQLSALSLEHIGRFLGSLKIGKSGQVFVMERSGMLVASSCESPTRRDSGSEEAAAVLFHGEVIGLLNLANKESDYTETDRALPEAMGGRIAPLLYARIQKRLREDERVKAEEALRESESRSRTLFETMTEGFSIDEIIRDETGKPRDLRYLRVNPAFESHTGLKAADLVGRTTL